MLTVNLDSSLSFTPAPPNLGSCQVDCLSLRVTNGISYVQTLVAILLLPPKFTTLFSLLSIPVSATIFLSLPELLQVSAQAW